VSTEGQNFSVVRIHDCVRRNNGNLSVPGDYQERLVAYLPFFHLYGLGVILMRSIFHGCKLVTMPKFETQQLATVLKNHRVSFRAGD